MGIQPDVLVCRSEYPLTEDIRGKIALFCNVPVSNVLQNLDVEYLYEMDVKKKQTPAEDFKLISCLCSHVCFFFLCLSYLVCLCSVCQATAYF